MFCSQNCYDTAFKRYHQYECPVMEKLLKSGSVHMALRLFFVALSTFDGSVEDLEKFLKDNASNATIFDVDFKSKAVENDKKLLLALTSLVKSSIAFSLMKHEEILKNHPQLKSSWEGHKEFIKSFLLQQCQASDLNFHGIFSGSLKKDEKLNTFSDLQQSIGSGSFLFSSLINHSCSSNLSRLCIDGKIVHVVCHPIPRGGQLFDCCK